MQLMKKKILTGIKLIKSQDVQINSIPSFSPIIAPACDVP